MAGFLAINVFVAVIYFFVTTSWNDWYTATGYWLTLSGLFVAIGELYRARTVGRHIRIAIDRESARHRGYHYRYCLETAKSILTEARTHVDGKY